MKHWQWGWIMFGLVMVCYYLTNKQEGELIGTAFAFLFVGTMLSLFEMYNKESK